MFPLRPVPRYWELLPAVLKDEPSTILFKGDSEVIHVSEERSCLGDEKGPVKVQEGENACET